MTNDSGLDLVILEPGDDGAGDDRGATAPSRCSRRATAADALPDPTARLAGPRHKLHEHDVARAPPSARSRCDRAAAARRASSSRCPPTAPSARGAAARRAVARTVPRHARARAPDARDADAAVEPAAETRVRRRQRTLAWEVRPAEDGSLVMDFVDCRCTTAPTSPCSCARRRSASRPSWSAACGARAARATMARSLPSRRRGRRDPRPGRRARATVTSTGRRRSRPRRARPGRGRRGRAPAGRRRPRHRAAAEPAASDAEAARRGSRGMRPRGGSGSSAVRARTSRAIGATTTSTTTPATTTTTPTAAASATTHTAACHAAATSADSGAAAAAAATAHDDGHAGDGETARAAFFCVEVARAPRALVVRVHAPLVARNLLPCSLRYLVLVAQRPVARGRLAPGAGVRLCVRARRAFRRAFAASHATPLHDPCAPRFSHVYDRYAADPRLPCNVAVQAGVRIGRLGVDSDALVGGSRRAATRRQQGAAKDDGGGGGERAAAAAAARRRRRSGARARCPAAARGTARGLGGPTTARGGRGRRRGRRRRWWRRRRARRARRGAVRSAAGASGIRCSCGTRACALGPARPSRARSRSTRAAATARALASRSRARTGCSIARACASRTTSTAGRDSARDRPSPRGRGGASRRSRRRGRRRGFGRVELKAPRVAASAERRRRGLGARAGGAGRCAAAAAGGGEARGAHAAPTSSSTSGLTDLSRARYRSSPRAPAPRGRTHLRRSRRLRVGRAAARAIWRTTRGRRRGRGSRPRQRRRRLPRGGRWVAVRTPWADRSVNGLPGVPDCASRPATPAPADERDAAAPSPAARPARGARACASRVLSHVLVDERASQPPVWLLMDASWSRARPHDAPARLGARAHAQVARLR